MENEQKFKLTTPIAILIAGALITLGIIVSRNPNTSLVDKDLIPTKQEATLAPEKVAKLSEKDHILGNKETAKILLITFTDLECPVCKIFHQDMLKQIEKYPGQILWVYRNYPLDMHPKAYNEAIASECVAKIGGNDTYWKYINTIFENTPSNNKLDPALLEVFAEKVGISKALFNKCMTEDKESMEKLVDEDLIDIANIGATGTPYSIIVTKDQQTIQMKGYSSEYLRTNLEAVLGE